MNKARQVRCIPRSPGRDGSMIHRYLLGTWQEKGKESALPADLAPWGTKSVQKVDLVPTGTAK